MTLEEVNSVFDELRNQGLEDEDIVKALGKLFEDGDITKEQLGELCKVVGYELDEDFANMSDEEAKKSLWGKVDEKVEESGTEEAPEAPEDDKEDDSDEDEKKKAMGLMGLGE